MVTEFAARHRLPCILKRTNQATIVEVVLGCHDVPFHGCAIVLTGLVVVALVARHAAEENVPDRVAGVGEHSAVLFAVALASYLALHHDIAGATCSLLLRLLLLLPHLGYAPGELFVHRHFHIGILLDQNDAVVEVVMAQGDAQGRVPVDVL